MKNPKYIGNKYERKIIDIVNKIFGSDYKRTKYSGGADDPGDMKDYWKTTPLAKYIQEIKYHGSKREFRGSIINNIDQAINQTPANRNWQLIMHLPETQTEIVIMDLQDYLVNDVMGQMLIDNKELKDITDKIKSNLRLLRTNIDKLISKL